ncbi:DUF6302 family protein [Streptomyces sp. NPDC046203]|uniref:DUF6302 family protein n=1 Tax=Streptomyces sp. NPDC046203 TaxID=3154602 RepID=UPI0033D4DF23
MGRPLAVLRPPAEADDQEAAYYRERLEDPRLMTVSLAVRVSGFAYLAVPVGGRRLGGFLPMPELVTGWAVRSLLLGQSGFPHVRLSWSPYLDSCHVVAWGERPPDDLDDEGYGRFYGYSRAAIDRFVARQGRAACS